MRKMTVFLVLAALCCAVPTPARADDSHRLVKVLAGAGALAIGATVAAKSSQTTTLTNTLGTSTSSTFSPSQLTTGLVVAGVGGIVLWDGLRDHDRSRPSTSFGVAAGKQTKGLFVRRTW